MFKLRFDPSEIDFWANRYSYSRGEGGLVSACNSVRLKGKLDRSLLKLVVDWKSPRSAGHVLKNSEQFVEEMTAVAFSAKDERSRIESLTLLDGVSWPTASVILHLFHPDSYPILDFRALWSLGSEVPKFYSFDFWWPYVECCRNFYETFNCNPRTFDRAVWQYSKENQKL